MSSFWDSYAFPFSHWCFSSIIGCFTTSPFSIFHFSAFIRLYRPPSNLRTLFHPGPPPSTTINKILPPFPSSLSKVSFFSPPLTSASFFCRHCFYQFCRALSFSQTPYLRKIKSLPPPTPSLPSQHIVVLSFFASPTSSLRDVEY